MDAVTTVADTPSTVTVFAPALGENPMPFTVARMPGVKSVGVIEDTAIEAVATVTEAEADFPSLVAVTTVFPLATAVTSPLAVTVAFVGSELDQTIKRPVTMFPLASLRVAVNC